MPLHITSLQNPRIKESIKLRDRRGRERQGRIIIDGTRELERAIDAGVSFVELFYCPELADDSAAQRVHDKLSRTACEQISVTADVFAKLAFGERAEGLIGVAVPPQRTLADLALPPNPLLAVLVGVEKPGNVGAILRSADGAGLSAVIVVDGGTDLFNPNAIRASLGTIFTMPVVAASTAATLEFLSLHHIHPFAARVDGELNYSQASYLSPTAFVLGSEAHGLPTAWQRAEISGISLPMCGAADSLNVSTTAAILFYEALRQRRVGQSLRD